MEDNRAIDPRDATGWPNAYCEEEEGTIVCWESKEIKEQADREAEEERKWREENERDEGELPGSDDRRTPVIGGSCEYWEDWAKLREEMKNNNKDGLPPYEQKTQPGVTPEDLDTSGITEQSSGNPIFQGEDLHGTDGGSEDEGDTGGDEGGGDEGGGEKEGTAE